MSAMLGSPTPSAETSFDIDRELQKLLGDDPWVLELPSTLEGVTSALYQLRRYTVQLIAARLIRDPPGIIQEQQWKKLAAFLAAMHNLEMIDPKMKSKALLDQGLEVIFNPMYNFPPDYAQVARYIYDKLEAEHWGADQVEAEDGVEEDSSEMSNSGSTAGPTAAIESQKAGPLRRSDFPADTHPIYGLNGIMHHILRMSGPSTTSYQISPNFRSKDARVFGHNGLRIGDCWPKQIALLRDGGHGQRMGGISGTTDMGTYSIVVSGAYDDLDKDEGNHLFYSGSNSHDNTASTPVTSNKTKALERSIATRRPVRVFRSSQGKWRHVPRAGLRYDGLYTIVGMSIEKNQKGGAYKRFRLVRNSGQADIAVHMPGQYEIDLFAKVKEGYPRTRS